MRIIERAFDQTAVRIKSLEKESERHSSQIGTVTRGELTRRAIYDPLHRRGGVDMKGTRKFLRDRSGASAAEYALILAIVGTGIALAAFGLGGVIAASMNDTGTCISTSGATCPV